MNKGLIVLGLMIVAGAANAQMNFTGGTLTENFDGLNTTSNPFDPGGTIGVQANIPVTPFMGTKIAGTGTAALPFISTDGSSNSGAIDSFGAVGSSERALGSIASGSNTAAFGVQIINGTGLSITSMTISFTQENWRSSTSVVNTTAAAWARSGGAVTASNFLPSTAMTAVSSLDLVGPAAVTTNGLLDGNLVANQVGRTTTLTFASAPLLAGQSIYLRWQDFNDAGNDAGLAIDNMSVTATAVPEPASMAALGVGIAALLRRRRNK